MGRNATLILNFPPDQSGELPAADVNVLQQLGTMITNRLGTDKLQTAQQITASVTRQAGLNRTYDISNVADGDKDSYWAAPDGANQAEITIEWDTPQTLYYVMLMEYIKLGQRVKGFKIETSLDGSKWTKYSGTTTTIGYKRIIPLGGKTTTYTGVQAKYLRISITDSKSCPTLHTVAVY